MPDQAIDDAMRERADHVIAPVAYLRDNVIPGFPDEVYTVIALVFAAALEHWDRRHEAKAGPESPGGAPC